MGEFGNGGDAEHPACWSRCSCCSSRRSTSPNLATARSLDRAREVGVRKSLGAGRGGLARPVSGRGRRAERRRADAGGRPRRAGDAGLPGARRASRCPSPTSASAGSEWSCWPLATGLAAGIYPALVLSGFRPAEVLKGRFTTSARGQGLRQGLVVVQFGISVALIAATGIVFTQLRHMQSQDLGLDLGGETSQLVVLPFMRATRPSWRAYRVCAPASTPCLGVLGTTAPRSRRRRLGPTVAGTTVDGPGRTERRVQHRRLPGRLGLRRRLRPGPGRRPHGPRAPGRRAAGVAARVGAERDRRPRGRLRLERGHPGRDGSVLGHPRPGRRRDGRPPRRGLADGRRAPSCSPSTRGATSSRRTCSRCVSPRRACRRRSPASSAAWSDAAPTRPFTYSVPGRGLRRAVRLRAPLRAPVRRFLRPGYWHRLRGAVRTRGARQAAQRTKEIGVRRVLGATVGQIVVLLSRNVVALVAAGVVVGVPGRGLGDVALARRLRHTHRPGLDAVRARHDGGVGCGGPDRGRPRAPRGARRPCPRTPLRVVQPSPSAPFPSDALAHRPLRLPHAAAPPRLRSTQRSSGWR